MAAYFAVSTSTDCSDCCSCSETQTKYWHVNNNTIFVPSNYYNSFSVAEVIQFELQLLSKATTRRASSCMLLNIHLGLLPAGLSLISFFDSGLMILLIISCWYWLYGAPYIKTDRKDDNSTCVKPRLITCHCHQINLKTWKGRNCTNKTESFNVTS